MNCNARNDSKVRYEFGEGGAPEEASNHMDILVSEYEEAGRTLTRLGFNGGLLDIKAKVVEKIIPPVNDEAAVQAIIDNKAINNNAQLEEPASPVTCPRLA